MSHPLLDLVTEEQSNWLQVIKNVDSNLVKFDYLGTLWASPGEFDKFCVRIFMSPNCLALRQTDSFLIRSEEKRS